MKTRKVLSLLLALVFAVSLAPVFTVTGSAVEYDPPAKPVAWWWGTCVEWKPSEGTVFYTVEISYIVTGHDPVTVMDAIVRVDGTTVTEAKNRLGTPVLRACSYDEENGCFVLDASNVIQYENDKYMYRVAAVNYTNDKHTKSQSTATTGAAILGSKLMAGYTSKPHTVSVTSGYADKETAWKGETVTITYKASSLFGGIISTFDHWEVTSGGVTLADASAKTTTFTMPEQDVSIKAVTRLRDEYATQEELAFTTQPQSGTAKKSESYTFTWALNDTPTSIVLQEYGSGGWGNTYSLEGLNSYSVTYSETTSKYRIKASKGSVDLWSDEFTVTWTEDAGEQPNPFVDVSKSDPWYDAVLWAYYAKPQVTNGVDATHFGPTQTVTRGQCAAFLWRAMGEPEPKSTSNPFVDVPTWQYYYKPILWAVENGITKGTDATHFSPDQTLSTAHIITFLYRANNPGADGWWAGAAYWAEKDYASGEPFGVVTPVHPNTDCPRGYVVMFLQKAK